MNRKTLQEKCNELTNEVKRLQECLLESCNDCRSLRDRCESLARARQLENERANGDRNEYADSLRRAQEENQRNRAHFESRFETAQEELQRSCQQNRQQEENLRIQLFTALKTTRFADAEKIYHEIMDALSVNDRGAKSDLMYEYADMMIRQERYEEAEEVARDALKHRKSHVERGSPWSQDLKQSIRQLSLALCHQNSPAKQREAIVMHRDIWENESLHDWRAENGDRLCQIYATQRQYQEAQLLQQNVWNERRLVDGVRHGATMDSALRRIDMLDGVISTLDKKHRGLRERKKAKDFWEQEIIDFITEIWDSGRGVPEADSKVLNIGYRLGEAHSKRNDYLKAGEIFEKVWEGRKKSLGITNRPTLECGHRLGEIHYNQKEYAKAEIVLSQVWNERNIRPSYNYADTLASGHRLGDIYYTHDEFAKAETVIDQVWNERKTSLDDNDPETLKSGHLLGEIHFSRKNYAKAESILNQVWNGRKIKLGENNTETIESSHQLARSIYAQADGDKKKLSKGKTHLESLWESRKPVLEDLSGNAILSSSHLAAMKIGCLYGDLLLKSEDFPEAEKVLKRLWKLCIKPAGQAAVEATQVQVGHFWGICLKKQGQYSNARKVLELVLSRKSSMLGPSIDDGLETSKEV